MPLNIISLARIRNYLRALKKPCWELIAWCLNLWYKSRVTLLQFTPTLPKLNWMNIVFGWSNFIANANKEYECWLGLIWILTGLSGAVQLRLRYTLKNAKNYKILYFDRKHLSLKAAFKVKKFFSNANLVLEILQVKLLPEVNKQDLYNAFIVCYVYCG